MTNLRSGYLVIEGCFHCGNRISFFSDEPVPPVDEYREGDHFWSHLGNFQASQFDLRCEKCSRLIPLSTVMATMLCMSCNPECGVYRAGSSERGQKTWVYVALCADTSHASRRCIPKEGIRALNEYFNSGLLDPMKKIVVVSCKLRQSPDTCQGIVLTDTGLTDLY
ncbi:MAG: hypothetical protein AB1715_02780 [Acidobacteriota bacterium]